VEDCSEGSQGPTWTVALVVMMMMIMNGLAKNRSPQLPTLIPTSNFSVTIKVALEVGKLQQAGQIQHVKV
jgi:hypothetical protein